MWEWTRSVWAGYPYDPSDGRERLDAGDETSRVLRGGSFSNNDRVVRCGARRNYRPDFRRSYLGFRVILSPFTLWALSPLDDETLIGRYAPV